MHNKKIAINLSLIIGIALAYFYIPCYMFVLTWTKPVIAALAVAMMTISIVGVMKGLIEHDRKAELNVVVLLVILLLAFAVGFLSGWAGYGHQTEDWPKHNAIMRDLLERGWPVVYNNGGETALLTYYIGQYIFPCGIGKILHFSFEQTLILNWLWASVGLALVFTVFICATKATSAKKQLWCILMVLLAGGLMSLQQSVGSVLYPNDITIGLPGWQDYFLTYGRYMLQFRTNFISIRWAYGQTLVPWMIVLLLYILKDRVKYYVPLVLPAILFGTFTSFSIILIAIFFWAEECFFKKSQDKILKNTFSWMNCVSMASLGAILFVYYLGYVIQTKPAGEGFSIQNFAGRDIGIYLIFVLGSFGLYAIVALKENIKNIAFWACVVIMSVLPFFKFGVANDLLMGACIAPSMLLYALLTKWLFDKDTSQFRKGILVTLLLIGFIKPSLEIYTCVSQYDYSQYNPADYFVTMENFANRFNEDVSLDLRYNYYTYDAMNSLFMKTVGGKVT